MASDYYVLMRFRAINDWVVARREYRAGWPNFHFANYAGPRRTVYGHFLLRDDVVDWRDVPAAEYAENDLRTRFTGAHDYALRQGYQHGFPNGHQALVGGQGVYGTFLIVPGTCEWRDVPTEELGLGFGDPTRYTIDRWFTGASDYAARNGFAAGMPNGHYANYGQGWVCGTFLFPQGRAVWRDIRGRELGLPDLTDPPPPPPPPPPTLVPGVVGLLMSQAGSQIEGAGLRVGVVWNFTGEIRNDRLRVAAQEPAAGTSVEVGSRVNLRVELAEPEPQQGISSVTLVNRHQQGRSIEVFVWDGAVGTWSSRGTLNIGTSTTLSFQSGRLYTVVAVDRGLINCDGRPDTASCQRFRWVVRGDSGGIQLVVDII